MITLYGIVHSRTLRVLWMLEELGLEYNHQKLNPFKGELQTPEYASLNPNKEVPLLVDDDLTLSESMAINLYLVDKYGGDLKPASEAERALASQWSFWVVTGAEPHLLTSLVNKVLLPEEKRNASAAKAAEAKLDRPFKVLNDELEGKDYIVGDRFTVADLNVAAVLSWTLLIGMDLSPYPHLAKWLEKCMERPALKEAQSKN